MKDIIDNIKRLSQLSNYISLYINFDTKTIMKNIGKITGEIDKEYVEFLRNTNGLTILDYCFFGLKNNKLGVNVYENIRDLWQDDNLLTFKFWGISATSTGENFGYLDKKDKNGNHFIGYYSSENPENVYLVSSSFKIFITKFLNQVELAIEQDKNAIYLLDNNWFLNPEKLIENDTEMADYINNDFRKANYNLLQVNY